MNADRIMADFQFVDNKVIEFNIQNNLLNSKNQTIKIECEMDYEIINCTEVEDGFLGVTDFIVDLNGKIENNEVFQIHLIMRGNFVGSKSKLTVSKFGEMLEVNGTATLSQLSRAYLTSVTSLSGMPPINLPMVNIYAMKKHKEDNLNDRL